MNASVPPDVEDDQPSPSPHHGSSDPLSVADAREVWRQAWLLGPWTPERSSEVARALDRLLAEPEPSSKGPPVGERLLHHVLLRAVATPYSAVSRVEALVALLLAAGVDPSSPSAAHGDTAVEVLLRGAAELEAPVNDLTSLAQTLLARLPDPLLPLRRFAAEMGPDVPLESAAVLMRKVLTVSGQRGLGQALETTWTAQAQAERLNGATPPVGSSRPSPPPRRM